MRAVLLLVLVLLLALPIGLGWGQQARFSGEVVKVIDGDTLDLADGRRIRLMGVSAPERDEPGGAEATAALRALAERREITCIDSGERSHRRVVARCFSGEEDLARRLVQIGLARDCPRHSGGLYAADETAASRRLPLPGYCRIR
jgi:endonuclease YncB( thermonuclease family)